MSANSTELGLDLLIDVSLTAEDRKKFKKFVILLNQLSMMISPSGSSYKLENDLKKIRNKIKFEKITYLKSIPFYNNINDISNEFSKKYLKNKLDAPSIKFHLSLKEILVKSQVHQKLPCLQSHLLGSSWYEGNLLGLEALQTPKPKMTSKENAFLLTLIQEKFQERSQVFSSFYETLNDIQNGRSLRNVQEKTGPSLKGLPVSSLLESKKTEYEENRIRIMRLMASYQKSFWKTYVMLTEKNDLITRIGEMCSTYDLDTRKVKSLVLQSNTINLKSRVLHSKILTEWYTPDVLQAHSKIRHHLRNALMKLESEKVLTAHSLSSWESAGPRFHTLCKELTDLRNEIDNKRWIISKLNSTRDKEFPNNYT